jgi:hypothetical protein
MIRNSPNQKLQTKFTNLGMICGEPCCRYLTDTKGNAAADAAMRERYEILLTPNKNIYGCVYVEIGKSSSWSSFLLLRYLFYI